jgi:hypothetical protein
VPLQTRAHGGCQDDGGCGIGLADGIANFTACSGFVRNISRPFLRPMQNSDDVDNLAVNLIDQHIRKPKSFSSSCAFLVEGIACSPSKASQMLDFASVPAYDPNRVH